MVDYVSLAATGKRLIEGAGRQITIQKISSTDKEAGKPWRGQQDAPVDAEVTPVSAIVNPSDAVKLGIVTDKADLLSKTSQVALVAADSVAGSDLKTFDIVKDGSTTFQILSVQELKPGATALLYFVFMGE